MHTVKWFFAGAMTITSCIVPAQAEILSYVFQGTVDQLADEAGIFGSPVPGAAFRLTYFADFSLGLRSGGVGGFGGTNFLSGGTSFPADPSYPTIQISPISAVLEINGHHLDFSGAYYGNVQYTQNSYDVQFGGYATSWADFAAETRLGDVGPLLTQITSSLNSPYSASTFGSIDTLGSLLVDGVSVTGSTSFSYLWAAGTPNETTVSGSLIPSFYAVTAAPVPEPAAWILLALGLTGLSAGGLGSRGDRVASDFSLNTTTA